jgi:hypothetical protein
MRIMTSMKESFFSSSTQKIKIIIFFKWVLVDWSRLGYLWHRSLTHGLNVVAEVIKLVAYIRIFHNSELHVRVDKHKELISFLEKKIHWTWGMIMNLRCCCPYIYIVATWIHLRPNIYTFCLLIEINLMLKCKIWLKKPIILI